MKCNQSKDCLVLWPRPYLNSKWEMIGREGFCVDLCCTGPLLMESTVCDHHIHVYWPGSKMAAAAILELGTVPISEVLWSKSMCYLCRTTNFWSRNSFPDRLKLYIALFSC